MKKVLCPGEALIDFVSIEKTNDLKLSNTFLKKAGGAPANACGAMTKLGVESYFMGSVGSDPFGEYLIDYLNNCNINTSLVKKSKLNTTLAFVSIDDEGERDFKFNRGADAKYIIDDTNILDSFDAIHFASATAFLGDELEDSYNKILKYAYDKKKLISFDPNYRDALFENDNETFIKKSIEFIRYSTIVKLSEEELYLISEINDLDLACLKLQSLGVEFLLITLGKKGTVLYHDNKRYDIASIKVDMIDSTGAGDAFIGSVIAKAVEYDCLSLEKMLDIIKYANVVGALTTTKLGALSSIPTEDEVNSYL